VNIFLLQGLALGFAAVVQPGPLLAYLVTQTLSHGFRKTWGIAFAPLISDGPIICLALLVLTRLPAWLQGGMHLASGLFILYLAWGAYLQWRNFTVLDDQSAPRASQGLLKAAFMNALNPMPYIYWSLVTGPILVAGWKQSPADGLVFLLAFYAVMICGLLAILGLFSAARSLGNQLCRATLGISVLALAAFGLFQLWQTWL
jgi:threonine/homoserine/homoserine lactone efflux protein